MTWPVSRSKKWKLSGLTDNRTRRPLAAAVRASTAAVDARTAAGTGSTARLSVNPARFHFFDRDTGRAIRGRPAAATPS